MIVLFLTTHLNAGGITSYLFTLCKGLIRQKCSVVIASSGGDQENAFKAIGAELILVDINVKSELHPKLWKAYQTLKPFCQKRKCDVIHAQMRVTQVLGALLSQSTKIPLVTTCHGFFKKRLGRILFPCWGKKVIAISEQVQDHLQKDFRVSLSRISLVHHGIDLRLFTPVDENMRKEFQEKHGLQNKIIIGHIGRLSDVKGQDILIRAMKKVAYIYPQAQCVIVGQGKEEKALRELVKEYSLEEHVVFFPVVGQTAHMLRLFNVFVMPSRNEGLGLAVLEAQAMGLPVIVSQVGGLKTLVEDNVTGYFVPRGNALALAEKIVQVLKNPEQARLIGLNAREGVKRQWGSEEMVRKTLGVYREVSL